MLWVDALAVLLCLGAGLALRQGEDVPKWKKRLSMVMFLAAFCALCYLVAAALLLGGIR